jgi:hypothetical protein
MRGLCHSIFGQRRQRRQRVNAANAANGSAPPTGQRVNAANRSTGQLVGIADANPAIVNITLIDVQTCTILWEFEAQAECDDHKDRCCDLHRWPQRSSSLYTARCFEWTR